MVRDEGVVSGLAAFPSSNEEGWMRGPEGRSSRRGGDRSTKHSHTLFHCAVERLTAAGYEPIGLDHFALPEDPLSVAARTGDLHRNFQGYTTHAETDLLAFGVSAI